MRKLSGTLLALAGVSVGTYALLSGQNTVAPPPKISADPSVRAPTSAPQTPAEADPAAAAALPPSAATASIPSKVLNVADAAPRVAYPPSSGLPLDRARLTREIQLQLKRVGCYHGTIDGVWSATVRRSMKAFTDRVNATLSAEQPDIVLLAMLRSHQGSGCGVPCPPGHEFGRRWPLSAEWPHRQDRRKAGTGWLDPCRDGFGVHRREAPRWTTAEQGGAHVARRSGPTTSIVCGTARDRCPCQSRAAPRNTAGWHGVRSISALGRACVREPMIRVAASPPPGRCRRLPHGLAVYYPPKEQGLRRLTYLKGAPATPPAGRDGKMAQSLGRYSRRAQLSSPLGPRFVRVEGRRATGLPTTVCLGASA